MSLDNVKVNDYIYYYSYCNSSIIRRKVVEVTPSEVITESNQHFSKLDGKLVDNTGLLNLYAYPWDIKAEKIYKEQKVISDRHILLSKISMMNSHQMTPQIDHYLNKALEAYNSVKSFNK